MIETEAGQEMLEAMARQDLDAVKRKPMRRSFARAWIRRLIGGIVIRKIKRNIQNV
jgi:hypothetical protein